MLSAEDLMQIRANKAHPKTLPSMPPKEFVPTHSQEEVEAIHSMFEENLTHISQERAEKKNLLTRGEWLADDRVARVDHKIGSGWEAFGFDSNGKTYLQPEEALFLIEVSRLELWFSGTPVSVQQAYQILLNDDLCSPTKYRVYSHLSRQGYRLIRTNKPPVKRTGESSSQKTVRLTHSPELSLAPSPKRAKTDSSIEPVQFTTFCGTVPITKSCFQPPAAIPSDYDCIPNLVSGADSVLIKFSDPLLLPETIRNRQSEYLISVKDFFKSCKKLENEDEPIETYDLVSTRQFSVENNPLYSGPTKPLRIGKFIGEPGASHLGLFDQQSSKEEAEANDGCIPFCYNVYAPGRHFRKSNPGTPCYTLAITSWSSPLPSAKSMERYRSECDPESVPLIAVTGPGSDVSYYQLKGLVTPL